MKTLDLGQNYIVEFGGELNRWSHSNLRYENTIRNRAISAICPQFLDVLLLPFDWLLTRIFPMMVCG